MKITVFLLLLILVSFTNIIEAQTKQDTTITHIQTVDGNEFIGEILREDSSSVILKTENLGEITISKSDIKFQKKVNVQQIKKGNLWFANPQSTRYFWSPNGYGLEPGEGYYQNIWVMWNQFVVGVTDNISIGGGMIPLFLFAGGPTPIFITPKLSIPVEKNKLNLGVGGLFGTILGETSANYGILYGISTFGSPDNNVSLGLGYGFAGGEWASSPMLNINGMFRISSRGYFITENYYIDVGGEGVALLMFGGRWIIKRAAIDYGLVIPVVEGGEFVAVPWLGFTVPFGGRK
jgi:hypothetical protein